MSVDDNLPVILVSAVDAAAASAIITELMDDGTSPPQCNGVGHGDEEEAAPVWRWVLSNKYYSAAVRLRALPDHSPPGAGAALGDVQAHLIYLTENECADTASCVRRSEAAAAAAAAAVGGDAVRLVAARAAHEPAPLAEWARRRRYELVALLAPPDADEPFPAAVGVPRLREALHAHVWPNMRRAGSVPVAPHALSSDAGDSSDSSSEAEGEGGEWGEGGEGGEGGEWGAWRGADGDDDDAGDEAGAVRRAAQFAEALALLPARAAAAAAADAERRLRAEHVVAAFCRALGHDLRDLPGDGDGGDQ